MKKMIVYAVTAVACAVGVSAAYASQAIKPFQVPSSVEEHALVHDLTTKLENRKKEIILEAEGLHGVQLSSYKELGSYADIGVHNDANMNSLRLAIKEHVIRNQSQQGDVAPFIYLNTNEKEAITVQKKVDGASVITTFVADHERAWIIKEQKIEKGKPAAEFIK
ncbi:hypothetical protein [Paenibacillus sp. YYML68]|uniref:hypothetical protein n=1 Tax=Paenibacillus sp. YYML68 TaxID=2909250 RepID=UPI00248FF984|nr:hypothetical protein [Paenibacillus sp. YYML68]